MLQIKSAFCLMLLLMNGFVFGRTIPCPCEFGLSAEWLFMLPAYDKPYFGGDFSQENGDITIRRCPNEQSFHSGYRLDLIYAWCNCFDDMRFRWTHFPTFQEARTIANGAVFPTLPFPSEVPATKIILKDDFRFYYLDFLLGWNAIDCCPFLLSFQGGLQYANLRFDEHGQVFNDDILAQTVDICSQFSGVGPEIGAELLFCFWRCFGLTARSYASLLVNKMNANSSITFITQVPPLVDPAATIKSKDYWHVVPYFDIRFGLTYSRPFDMSCWGCFNRCLTFDFEIGYETMWLYNAIERPLLIDIEGGTIDGIDLVDELMTFSLNGPYLHVGVTF